jgi:hypothetical protein
MSTLSSALYSSYEYLSSFGVQEVVNPSTPLVDYIVDKMVPYLPPDAAAYISNPSNYPEMLEQVRAASTRLRTHKTVCVHTHTHAHYTHARYTHVKFGAITIQLLTLLHSPTQSA